MYFGFKTILASLILLLLLFTKINPQCSDEPEDDSDDAPDESEETESIDADVTSQANTSDAQYDPCCSFPCQHGGICTSEGKNYDCDCMGTGYSGKNCESASLFTMLYNVIVPNHEAEHYLETHCEAFWTFVNNIKALHEKAIQLIYQIRHSMLRNPSVYMAGHEYVSMNSYYNKSWYAQDLQPIPSKCPKEMGLKGPTTLPPANEVVDYLLERDEFKPCPYGTNLMFAAYAQHFTHQFFRSDMQNIGVTLGADGVDASQIYGRTVKERNNFRSFKDGKLKVSEINGEVFPPYLNDVPGVHMIYPPGNTIEEKMKNYHEDKSSDVKPKFALAHPNFASTPFIFALSTIWIREHNRVCDVLKRAHPSWDDERLYQTARLIIIAEMVKITIEDYLQHMTQYKVNLIYDPVLTHNIQIQYQNTMSMEFNLMYHWHALLPDVFKFKGKLYNFTDLTFTCNEMVQTSIDDVISTMMKSPCGQITARNYPKWLTIVANMGIEWGRKLRLQSFNNYRRHFGLSPYRSFLELTDNPEIASALECLYRDVDAVEFFPGILIEKNTGSVVGPSMAIMGGAWSMKGLITNPVGSPGWWKPSSFGGNVGWNIIQNASLRSLLCQNLKNKCRGMHVGFAVPQRCIKEIRKKINKKDKQHDSSTHRHSS